MKSASAITQDLQFMWGRNSSGHSIISCKLQKFSRDIEKHLCYIMHACKLIPKTYINECYNLLHNDQTSTHLGLKENIHMLTYDEGLEHKKLTRRFWGSLIQQVGRPSRCRGNEALRPPASTNIIPALDMARTPDPGRNPVSRIPLFIPTTSPRFPAKDQGSNSDVLGFRFLVENIVSNCMWE